MAYNLGAGASGALSGAAVGAEYGGGWGAAAGGAIGALGGFGGSKDNAKKSLLYSMLMMQQQQAYEKEKMKNAHQWETEDLIKAGLNPALTAAGATAPAIATGGGGGAGLAGSIFGAQRNADTQGLDREINSAFKAMDVFNTIRAAEDEAGLKKSQIDVNDANIGNINADTASKVLNNKLVEKYGDKKAKAELASMAVQNQLTAQRVQETKARTQLLGQTMDIRSPDATIGKIDNEFIKNNPNVYKVAKGAEKAGNILNGFVQGFKGIKDVARPSMSARRISDEYFNSYGEFRGRRDRVFDY